MIRIIFIKTGAGQTYPPRKSQKRTPSIYAGYQVKRGNLVGADQAEQEHAGKPPATRGPAAGGARCAQNQKAKQPTNKSTKMRRSCLLSGALSDDETRRRSFAKTGSGQTSINISLYLYKINIIYINKHALSINQRDLAEN
jgi:hypothetical protein